MLAYADVCWRMLSAGANSSFSSSAAERAELLRPERLVSAHVLWAGATYANSPFTAEEGQSSESQSADCVAPPPSRDPHGANSDSAHSRRATDADYSGAGGWGAERPEGAGAGLFESRAVLTALAESSDLAAECAMLSELVVPALSFECRRAPAAANIKKKRIK